MSQFRDRVRFFTRNGDGDYTNFRGEDADFQEMLRGNGYRLNNVSQDTPANEVYRIIRDILDGLRSSHVELQNTRIADITSPYSKNGSLLPVMNSETVMRDLLFSRMPATPYMQIHVMLDPVRGGRKRKTRRQTRRKRR
jgi:hypothetical protein